MKVHFKGIISHDETVNQGASALTPGAEYEVLELYARTNGENFLRIESIPDQLPGLFDSRLFEVTDSKISPTWKAFIDPYGGVAICPPTWNKPGFWESLMDGEKWAIDLYATEKAKIHSVTPPSHEQ